MIPVIGEKRHIISTVCVIQGGREDQRTSVRTSVNKRPDSRGSFRFNEIPDNHL